MAAHVQDSSFFTRRGIVAVAIIGLHVLVAWALASGLARKVVEVTRSTHRSRHRRRGEERRAASAAAAAEMERPPVEVPPPEVTIDLPMETTTTAIQDVTDKPPPPAPPPPPRVAGSPAKMTSPVESGSVLSAGSQAPRGAGFPSGAGLRRCQRSSACANPWSPKLPASRSSTVPRSRSPRPIAYTPATEGGTALPESCIKFKVKFVIKAE